LSRFLRELLLPRATRDEGDERRKLSALAIRETDTGDGGKHQRKLTLRQSYRAPPSKRKSRWP